MLRVLLVDDEPFILQGLQMLIDWEKEGFSIVATQPNGEQAYQYLKENEVDLIITDIRMPTMTGLELLQKIREENLSQAWCVILSGFADFSYAKQAIQYKCTDYILKPVDRGELIRVLEKVRMLSEKQQEQVEAHSNMDQVLLTRDILALSAGKSSSQETQYVRSRLNLNSSVRFVVITFMDHSRIADMGVEERRALQDDLYKKCCDFLHENENCCIRDASLKGNVYDVSIIYGSEIDEDKDEKQFFLNLRKTISAQIDAPIIILAGKKVPSLEYLSQSYNSIEEMLLCSAFYDREGIVWYEEEMQEGNGRMVLCKTELDELINAINIDDHARIKKNVDILFSKFQEMGLSSSIVSLNVNYLVFNLIHLASQQNSELNQREILTLISDNVFETGLQRGCRQHITRFTIEYADYLLQLHRQVPNNVLHNVATEVQEHYYENLTLKELGEKYNINSAYLGQLFRKSYGCSFKDYLNRIRMEQAQAMLLKTDKKVYEIADAVGYKDLDYFVNQFIAYYGCTPTRFRRQRITEAQDS